MDEQYIEQNYLAHRHIDWWLRKNRGVAKKTSEKALIPLPPTGFAPLFCANDAEAINMIGSPAGRGLGG